MPKNAVGVFMLLFVIFLSACQGQADGTATDALPTQVNIAALETDSAATRFVDETRNAPTPTTTGIRPTLPPSFTPTESATPESAPVTPSVTSVNTRALGTIYYIYNGDSIIALSGDGLREEFIFTAGMDVSIQYLTPSPDGRWLAFVAPGSGSAREVWIMSRDGTYTQQVSCRGMADVQLPTWSMDGEWLAFTATQSLGGPLDIYAATRFGTPCSEGTQRLLADINSTAIGGMAFEPSGQRLFFSRPELYALDLTTGEISEPLSHDLGLGPSYNLAFRSQSSTLLTFLQPEFSSNLTTRDGYLYAIDVAGPSGILDPVFKISSATDSYQWSADGQYVLMSSQNSIYQLNQETKISSNVVFDTEFPPIAVYSPTQKHLVYVDADPENPDVAQLYVVDIDGRTPMQVTFNTEGTISDVIWIAGSW